MKLDFRRWLVEAKAPLGPPEIVGFQNSTYVNGEYEQSEMFPTYHAALQARRDQFDKLNRMATTWAVFKDGTRRTMGDAAWFRKRNGDTVNDSRVTRSGRGATLHAYRAKDDRNYQFLAALSILERELRMLMGMLHGILNNIRNLRFSPIKWIVGNLLTKLTRIIVVREVYLN